MMGWHHRLNVHEFEQTLEDGERQGSLVCCSPWGRKELDMAERLNNESNLGSCPDVNIQGPNDYLQVFYLL